MVAAVQIQLFNDDDDDDEDDDDDDDDVVNWSWMTTMAAMSVSNTMKYSEEFFKYPFTF